MASTRANELAAREQRCGNCRFWELSGYAERNDMESGVGGYSCNGDVSNCRRHAPRDIIMRAVDPDAHLRGNREWPTTKRTDWCGEWEQR